MSNSKNQHTFIRHEKLGEGTYGIVFKAEDVETHQTVALKVMKLQQEEDGIPTTLLRELSILKSVSHPNIVKLESFFLSKDSIQLAFEFVEYDLRTYLRRSKMKMKPDLIQSYAFQLIAGLNFLHKHRIIHRDVKPDNLLLNKDGILKICDFGLARHYTIPLRQYSINVVSEWYRAPELLFGSTIYGPEIDVWSAGCILGEMCRGSPLFAGDSDVDQLHKIFSVLGTPTKEQCPSLMQNSSFSLNEHDNTINNIILPMNIITVYQEGSTKKTDFKSDNITFTMYPKRDLTKYLETTDLNLIDLIQKMLVYEPDKRITLQEAMNHPYFDTMSQRIRYISSYMLNP